jgi:energy-coupling factor transporter transmembrane protein EcfT
LNPFALQPLSGPLPRLSALAKAIFLICLSVAAMRLDILASSLLLALLLVLGALMGLRLGDGAAASRGLAVLLVFSALARGLFPGDGRIFAVESLRPSIIYALRLGTIFAAARLFYASTRVAELGDYLSAGFRRLRRVAASFRKRGKARGSDRPPSLASDPGMMLSLSLLFIPRAFESYKRIRESAESRGYGVGRSRFFPGLALLQALVFSSVKNSLRTAEAMEARSYSPERRIMLSRLKSADMLLIGLGLFLAFLPF